jgi:hypothetical protein
MIELTRDQWFTVSDELLDNDLMSQWEWDEETDLMTIHFADPRQEIMFLLRFQLE